MQRLEHFAEFHLPAFPLGPPFLAVNAVSRKEAGQANRRLGHAVFGSIVSSDRHRLQPGQSHGDAQASEKSAARKQVAMWRQCHSMFSVTYPSDLARAIPRRQIQFLESSGTAGCGQSLARPPKCVPHTVAFL